MANSRVEFTVVGVESDRDAAEVEDALDDREGVQLVDIDPGTGETEVRYGEELVSGEKIQSTVEELGYEVEPEDGES